MTYLEMSPMPDWLFWLLIGAALGVAVVLLIRACLLPFDEELDDWERWP
jgi:hypothetical protein